MSLENMMQSLPTESRAVVFDNEKYFGIVISFAEKGFGFGEITFSVNKETGESHFDNEAMGMETCARILSRIVGTEVGEYKSPFHEGEATEDGL